MNTIRVRAQISLLPVEKSGRTGPVRGSYRPNHNFGGTNDREMDIGFIDFAEGEELHPGQTIEHEITFWSRPGLKEILVPGREWRIQEGGRLVEVGTVLKVVEDPA